MQCQKLPVTHHEPGRDGVDRDVEVVTAPDTERGVVSVGVSGTDLGMLFTVCSWWDWVWLPATRIAKSRRAATTAPNMFFQHSHRLPAVCEVQNIFSLSLRSPLPLDVHSLLQMALSTKPAHKGATNMNSTQFIGNLGNDPTEIRLTKAGTPVTNLRVAVNNRGTDRTAWIQVVVFGNVAEAAVEFLAKGDEVGVTGELAMNEWFDDDGRKRQDLHVIARTLDFLRHRKTASDDTADLQTAS